MSQEQQKLFANRQDGQYVPRRETKFENFYNVDLGEGIISRRRGGNGEWVFIFSSKGWSALTRQIDLNFDTRACSLLFEMGHRYGFSLADDIRHYHLEHGQALKILCDRISTAGWGRMSIAGNPNDTGELVVSVRNCAQCEDRTEGAGCYFLSGVISGAITSLYGQAHLAIESACESAGCGYCEFRLEPDEYPT